MPPIKTSGTIKLENIPEPVFRLAFVLRGFLAVVRVLRIVVFRVAIII